MAQIPFCVAICYNNNKLFVRPTIPRQIVAVD